MPLRLLFIAALASLSISVHANSLEQQLELLTAKLAPALPMVVDDFTVLRSVSVDGGAFIRTFHIDVPAESINSQEFAQSMQPTLIHYVCNTPNQQTLLQLGGQYGFIYEAQDDELIYSLFIEQSDCSK